MSRERRNVLRGAQARRKIMQEKKTFKVLNQHASDQDVLFDWGSLKALNRQVSCKTYLLKNYVVEKIKKTYNPIPFIAAKLPEGDIIRKMNGVCDKCITQST